MCTICRPEEGVESPGFQIVVIQQMWVLGTRLGSLAGTASALNHRVIFQVLYLTMKCHLPANYSKIMRLKRWYLKKKPKF